MTISLRDARTYANGGGGSYDPTQLHETTGYTMPGAPDNGGYSTNGATPGGNSSTPVADYGRGDRQQAGQMAYWAGLLAEQAASRKGQDAYNKKKLQLEQQGLGLQADQLAKQYAMDQAKLEWDKQQFQQTFGQTVKQQDIDNKFRDQESALDNQWRTAEQTGFRDGAPTLAKMQFNEQTRQFDVGQQNNSRDFGEQQRQFDALQARAAGGDAEAKRQFDAQYGAGRMDEQRRREESDQQFAFQSGNATRNFEEAQRLANLGQANNQRDFGENQRQYNQNFGEDARRYNQDFGQHQTEFNTGQGNNERDFAEQVRQYGQNFGENQRQYNVSTVMNAPRGPADWAAYTARMRGLQSSGGLPGAVGTMFDPNAQVASYSNSGQQTGPVLSNTNLAMAMTGQGGGANLQGTPWQGMANGGSGQQQSSNSSDPYGGGGSQSQSNTQSPYGEGGGGNQMSLPSIQKFRKYSPTEQQMGLGYQEENGGPTAEDSQYLMQRQAPNYERSRTSRMAGL